jgi:hypothetical protein
MITYLADLQSLLRPDRELKKQGVVLMATSKKQSAYRYLFLFTDLLLVTKPKRMGKLYNFKRLFNLAVTRFDDVSDSLGTLACACVRWCVCA